jgi:hypothetical protein
MAPFSRGAFLLFGIVTAGIIGWFFIPSNELMKNFWLLRAVLSGQFLLWTLIAVLSAVATAALAALAWRVGKSRPRPASQDGAAVLEFAMVLPIALMMVLVMVQSSLLMAGNLCVHYAAFCAARSACVVIPTDMGAEEPSNVLAAGDSRKHARIQLAALWAVMPVSWDNYPGAAGPLSAGEVSPALAKFFTEYGETAPGWLDERLAKKFAYAARYTQVKINWDNKNNFDEHSDIYASVTHTFHLSVPYAARLFSAFSGGRTIENGEFGIDMDAFCVMTNEGVHEYIYVEQLPFNLQVP